MRRIMMRRFLLLLCVLGVAGCSTAPSASSGRSGGAGEGGRTVVPERCSMGFAELFQLAKGREWTEEEVQGFQALDQQGKNRVVKQLAAEAGCIRTEDQVGTDGVVYTAFWKVEKAE
jgi:hypothetical protein